MDGTETLVFLACAFGAQIIGTIAGFGAATILTPIASVFIPIKTAIAIVACFHLLSNAARLAFFGRAVDKRVLAQFGLVAVGWSFAAAAIMTRLPSAVIALTFGVFLISYVTLTLRATKPLQLPRRPLTLIGGGTLAGFVSGLIGTGGAIRSVCLLAYGLPKEVYLGTSAAIALAVDATRIPVYVAEGFVPKVWIPVVVSLIPVAFLGAWVGQRLVRRISAVAFQRLVLAMLAIMGVKLVWDGWHGLG